MVVLLHCEVLVPRKTDIDPAYAESGSSFHRLTKTDFDQCKNRNNFCIIWF